MQRGFCTFSASSFSKLMRQFIHIPALTSPIDTHSKSYLEIHLHNKKLAIHGGNACIFLFLFFTEYQFGFFALSVCARRDVFLFNSIFFFLFILLFFVPTCSHTPFWGSLMHQKFCTLVYLHVHFEYFPTCVPFLGAGFCSSSSLSSLSLSLSEDSLSIVFTGSYKR